MSKIQKWPADCVWPEPISNGCGQFWDEEDASLVTLDEEGEELLDIKDYFDELVEEGRLREDYSLNEEYFDEEEEDSFSEPDEFVPEIGEEYWDQGFLIEAWRDDLDDHLNLLKIDYVPLERDPICFVSEVTGYSFVNENLLRQAFTRRAFSIEYGLSGCNEELEFLGDSVLNLIVTRTIIDRLMDVYLERTDAPFRAIRKGYDEGVLTKIRSHFVSKEYLAKRAAELGLDHFILYGSGEEPTESSREDMMEALIGAVAMDSHWDQAVLEEVIDRLLCIQLSYPDEFLKQSFYDLFNAWHQKHFGCMPDYEVYGGKTVYATIRYRVPENDKGVSEYQRADVRERSRSEAREKAAFHAYAFVVGKGLWIQLKDAHLVPDPENSINQLQELYQKKYVEEAPQYEFEQSVDELWYCDCTCGGVHGYGRAASKTKAKKKAAYMILIRLLKAAGICEKEWEEKMER